MQQSKKRKMSRFLNFEKNVKYVFTNIEHISRGTPNVPRSRPLGLGGGAA